MKYLDEQCNSIHNLQYSVEWLVQPFSIGQVFFKYVIDKDEILRNLGDFVSFKAERKLILVTDNLNLKLLIFK